MLVLGQQSIQNLLYVFGCRMVTLMKGMLRCWCSNDEILRRCGLFESTTVVGKNAVAIAVSIVCQDIYLCKGECQDKNGPHNFGIRLDGTHFGHSWHHTPQALRRCSLSLSDESRQVNFRVSWSLIDNFSVSYAQDVCSQDAVAVVDRGS
jgi:hypothetical protein